MGLTRYHVLYAVSTMLPKPGDSLFNATAHVLIYLPIAVFAYTSGPDVVAVILLLIIYYNILHPDVKNHFSLISSV